MLKKGILNILLVLLMSCLYSQNLSNFRTKNIHISGDTISLDSLSVIPGSVILYNSEGQRISDGDYTTDPAKGLLIIKNRQSIKGNIKISYRVLPLSFAQKYFRKDIRSVYISQDSTNGHYLYSNNSSDERPYFAGNELSRRGSISRGISFGNNQDIIVNSNLNLQLSGKVNNNLSILAAISDNNIPIQPDGNTQQIQEFDKVYISLFNENNRLTLGDFEIKKPSGYFLNTYKKVQGGEFFTGQQFGKNDKNSMSSLVSGAVAKGKYNRQKITAIEGNQGPYKLRGADNESFVIILAGTEKIYIDGKLLKRGEDNDYVIDYNTAELTFTPEQPVTKDKRIIAEFEYSEKSYARFMFFNANEVKTKAGTFWFNIYSETDSKNQSIQQDLSAEDKYLLSQIGDSVNQAFVPNIDSVEFDNDYVLYKRMDTLVNGILYDSIYVHSTSPDSAFYRLGFSETGENGGNYIQETSTMNGRVFRWVAPVNGVFQGNYEPVILLVTPRKKQMGTIGGNINLGRNTILNTEFGITQNDINTFSDINSGDDAGYAFKFGVLQNIPLMDTARTKLTTGVNYQFIEKNFSPVERFRKVEFSRDWNLNDAALYGNEHFLDYAINYSNTGKVNAGYNFELMKKNPGLMAYRNNLTSALSCNGFKFDFNGSLLNSSDQLNNTSYLRNTATLTKAIGFIKLGAREELENNQWKLKSNDSLLANSFSYLQWEVFAQNIDSSENTYSLNYKNRKDYLPFQSVMGYATNSEDFGFGIKLTKSKKNQIKFNTTYRSLRIIDTLLSLNDPENTITGRFDHNGKYFKSAITTNSFYEAGSGMEVKKEFSYLEVSPGQGIYTWTDYNGNNIKELDEFEVSNFPDQANYIRIFIPTDLYIRTFTNQFSEMIYLRPDKIWGKEKGFKGFISRFSNQFAYRVNKKNMKSDNFIESLNPVSDNINDSALISINESLRNSFSFNKTSQKYGIDYIYQTAKNKVLMVNGFDSRTLLMNSLQVRWNINSYLTLLNNFSLGDKSFSSEYFSSKNYNLYFSKNESNLRFQPDNSLRFSLSYSYSEKKNTGGNENVYINDAGFEVKYNVVKKGSLTGKINYININYKYETNTPVGYEMLEGLLPGNNAVWSLVYQKNLSKTLQMDLSYNGRVSQDSKTIHMAGVQMRAYF